MIKKIATGVTSSNDNAMPRLTTFVSLTAFLALVLTLAATTFPAEAFAQSGPPPAGIIYYGEATVGGEPAPDGHTIVGRVGDYESNPAIVSGGRYAALSVAAEASLNGQTVTFFLGDVQADQTDTYQPHGIPVIKTGFDLTFSALSEPTPAPTAIPTNTPVQSQDSVDSNKLARFAALMQHIRSEPTPSDVNPALILLFDTLDNALSGIYITGFITPFTGETPEQVKARLQSIPAEDRFIAVMVESYRLADDDTLLNLIHDLLARYYVETFIIGTDLAGAAAYLRGSELKGLVDGFDSTDYNLPAPSAILAHHRTPPSQSAVVSDKLAKFAALMQYIRSEPTPSDVNPALILLFDTLDNALSGIYITGFITPFTGETPEQVKARLQSIPAEDRFIAVMVESYRLADDDTLLNLIHDLLARYYVETFIIGTDLAGAAAYLRGSELKGLVDGFDSTDYNLPAPTGGQTPTATPTASATPDASLALEVTAELAGYYSNDKAGVDVTLSLSDTQRPWREGVQTVSIVCRQGTEILAGCNDELKVTLLGDGGSDTQSATLRTPMGNVSLEFDFGGAEPLTLPFDVPQRILGVERDVWECFRDEPDTLAPSENDRGYYGDCAGWGWGNLAMWKWNQDIPVKVWVMGRNDYIATLGEALHELSPILDLDFVWVDSEGGATLKAYMGIPKSQVVSVGFPEYCAEVRIAGCGGPNRPTPEGLVESGDFGVWRYLDESGWWTDVGLLDTLIKHVTVHEALHALVPMAHREDPASMMDTRKSLSLPTLSRMDEDLIRLHQHRLVKPGMTMSEIERLIVFREDLLDSPPPRELDGYELVRSAFGRLQDADSARFRISGGWKSTKCNHLFGWADYEIADFGSSVAKIVHFEDGHKSHFIIAPKSGDGDWEYWIEESGQWKEVGQDSFSDDTSWRQGLSSPHVMLASVLFFSDANDIGVSKNRDGSITLTVTLDDAYARVSWSRGETLEVVLTLDQDTHQILEYEVEWLFNVREPTSCPRYITKAVNGEYGIELRIPDAIRERSVNISASPNWFPLDPGNLVNIPVIGPPAKASDQS